jgi:hypothetical protein
MIPGTWMYGNISEVAGGLNDFKGLQDSQTSMISMT